MTCCVQSLTTAHINVLRRFNPTNPVHKGWHDGNYTWMETHARSIVNDAQRLGWPCSAESLQILNTLDAAAPAPRASAPSSSSRALQVAAAAPAAPAPTVAAHARTVAASAAAPVAVGAAAAPPAASAPPTVRCRLSCDVHVHVGSRELTLSVCVDLWGPEDMRLCREFRRSCPAVHLVWHGPRQMFSHSPSLSRVEPVCSRAQPESALAGSGD